MPLGGKVDCPGTERADSRGKRLALPPQPSHLRCPVKAAGRPAPSSSPGGRRPTALHSPIARFILRSSRAARSGPCDLAYKLAPDI